MQLNWHRHGKIEAAGRGSDLPPGPNPPSPLRPGEPDVHPRHGARLRAQLTLPATTLAGGR